LIVVIQWESCFGNYDSQGRSLTILHGSQLQAVALSTRQLSRGGRAAIRRLLDIALLFNLSNFCIQLFVVFAGAYLETVFLAAAEQMCDRADRDD